MPSASLAQRAKVKWDLVSSIKWKIQVQTTETWVVIIFNGSVYLHSLFQFQAAAVLVTVAADVHHTEILNSTICKISMCFCELLLFSPCLPPFNQVGDFLDLAYKSLIRCRLGCLFQLSNWPAMWSVKYLRDSMCDLRFRGLQAPPTHSKQETHNLCCICYHSWCVVLSPWWCNTCARVPLPYGGGRCCKEFPNAFVCIRCFWCFVM